MKNLTKIISFVFLLFLFSACNTVLGPPGSENDLPPLESGPVIPYDSYIEGQPNLDLAASRGGLYIWKEGDNWHVRLANVEGLHAFDFEYPLFSGVIEVRNGMIVNVEEQNVYPSNEVRAAGMSSIYFDFELKSGIEGFDFRIQPTHIDYCVVLDLQFNARPSPRLVNLGKTMFNPEAVPVPICFDYPEFRDK
jgi:hypothetical protein